MKIKMKMYPSTSRVGENYAVVTEKIDGSNLGLFKLNGVLHIAQRNTVFTLDEIEDGGLTIYRGLKGWLEEYGAELQDILHEGSAVWGEWIGMGHIGYGDSFEQRFLIYAKANVNEKMELVKPIWKRELFIYPFIGQEIPSFMGVVPMVHKKCLDTSVSGLDALYDEYCAQVGRKVEGFIVQKDNHITKYVRLKRNIMQDHFGPGEGPKPDVKKT